MKYIVAVSGGIDSVVLLDIMNRHSKAELVVAHVDHAVRDDSADDEAFVRELAKKYHLPYISTRLSGEKHDEASLRQARYAFLEDVRQRHDADAIAMAHHQDDVLETIIINHLRGTGWRGLSSLRSHPTLHRPLLPMSKAGIVRYAIENALEWREDPSNQDVRYLRNAVRHHVMPRLMQKGKRAELTDLHHKQRKLGDEIHQELARLHQTVKGERGIKRYQLIMLPRAVAEELLYFISPSGLQARHVRQLLYFARSGRVGAKLRLPDGLHATVTADELIVTPR